MQERAKKQLGRNAECELPRVPPKQSSHLEARSVTPDYRRISCLPVWQWVGAWAAGSSAS